MDKHEALILTIELISVHCKEMSKGIGPITITDKYSFRKKLLKRYLKNLIRSFPGGRDAVAEALLLLCIKLSRIGEPTDNEYILEELSEEMRVGYAVEVDDIRQERIARNSRETRRVYSFIPEER